MTADARRVLGYGLLGGAAGIALLMVAWLLTSGVQAGGAVLGLLLLFVLAGPLVAAGAYVLARGKAEQAEEQQFAGKRRILEADRLFRRELATQLRQLATTPNLPGEQLQHMAEAVERSAAEDQAAWYAAVQLDDTQAAVLRLYDDLVWERVRWVRDHHADPGTNVVEAVNQLQTALDQRTDLLIRGRSAPAVAPQALLGAETRALPAEAPLAVGDALSYDGIDYVVEAIAACFADGQRSQLVHLIPSGAGASEHWLSVSPGGIELAWLDVLTPSEPAGARELRVGGASLPLVGASSALVEVQTARGSTPGVLVSLWRYRSDRLVGIVEQWPDGTQRAYAGRLVERQDLEIWPARSPRSGAMA
jgi:hypothetical protein